MGKRKARDPTAPPVTVHDLMDESRPFPTLNKPEADSGTLNNAMAVVERQPAQPFTQPVAQGVAQGIAWSVADPAMQQALIVALIESDGDVDVACKKVGCSFADYLHMTTLPEFKTLQAQIIYARVDVPNQMRVRVATTETAAGGNAYAAKVLQDTAATTTAAEDEARESVDMRLADRGTLVRKLEDQARQIVSALEKASGEQYIFQKVTPSGAVPIPIVTEDDIAADLAQPYDDSPAAPS